MTATATATAALTHPRISERRAAVDEARFRSRSRRLTIAGIVVLIALLGVASTQSPLLDVDEVRVIGAERHSPEVIRELAALDLGTPLLGLDTAAAQQRLAGLPHLASVRVDKDWAGIVTIEVVERTPAARFAGDEGTLLVAADGVVLELAQSPDGSEAGLPLISGAMFSALPGASVPDVVHDALSVAAALPGDIAALVERIEISVDTLSMRLGGGALIDLGDGRELDTKFDAIRAFFAQVELDCLDVLDVAAPTVPVITRRSSCLS